MSTAIIAAGAKKLLSQNNVQKRFEEILGRKSQGFLASVMQVVSSSKYLANADPQTVLTAAATAAILDLPINPNLGFAYIVPYKGQAAFQMGWKGFVQLAQRTGKYVAINAVCVYANQLKSFDSLSEILDADFSIDGEGEVIGYVAYFRLNNGFSKTVYWNANKVREHGKKYSKSFSSPTSAWVTNFDAMALKTVLKNALSKWGPLSIEMETAVLADSSVQIKQGQYSYPDNDNVIEITELSAEQKEYNAALEEWTNTIDSLSTIGDFSGLLKSLTEIDNSTLSVAVNTYFRQALKANGMELRNEGTEIVKSRKATLNKGINAA